jgi:pimeloyl-ACP methyl ester carboxylesterase
VNPKARPLVVVDPRAGHGPGIGGFKSDSEVGVAMRAGHPVYFVTFYPQPEEGQTLVDVMQAEARFLEEVAARHPASSAKPVVIGNCQAGWAIASLAAVRPELFGPLMVMGAPMSYWAGGSQLNPMRYSGATLGGAWLAALSSDLGANRFDGAYLVENFEKLNPANSLWGKYHRLWSEVDTEAERFLEFERWWGGFFRMSGPEIETIVENLFVGNRLARGQVMAGDARVDLRNITAPVVVFASWGDNITPPPQALNWIIDVWGDERAIAAAGRVIVYVLHESVGHLGIFVGGDIAKKEHSQLVNSLDVIENLPPGLYELKLRHKDGMELERWDDLEPGSYTANFEHRTMDHLRAVNPEGREEEALFSTMAKLSEINTSLYKTWVRPWLQPMVSRPMADAMTHMHPLRWQRQMFADGNPGAAAISAWADQVREQRHALPVDHPGRQWERSLSTSIESSLNLWRDLRDQSVVQWTRLAYGPLGLGAVLPPDISDETLAVARAQGDLDAVRREVLGRIGEGGFAQAVCRIVLAGMVSIGSFERRSFRLARLLSELPNGKTPGKTSRQGPGNGASTAAPLDWRRLMRDEARVAAVAPVEALNALSQMLPDTASRERALAMAAAVMMIEPTLNQPRSEIIELLIGMLDVQPERVMDLAFELTAPLGKPGRGGNGRKN